MIRLNLGIGRLLRRLVELPVHVRVAQNGLHVFAGFGEGDGFHKLRRIAIMALAQPIFHAIRTGIVSCERVLELPVVLVDHVFALARETAPALNSDSCRISDATRKGSSPLTSEYFRRSLQYAFGNSASQ